VRNVVTIMVCKLDSRLVIGQFTQTNSQSVKSRSDQLTDWAIRKLVNMLTDLTEKQSK